MEEKLYCVYKHTNKINGKMYIGVTCQNIKERWKNGKGYRRNEVFYSEIKLYGWDNFTHEVLSDSLPKEKAFNYERALIEQYDSINNGYNLSGGGAGCGTLTDTTKQKMSVSKTGINHPRSKAVICLNTLDVFESSNIARIEYGMKSKRISSACKDNTKTSGKHPVTGEKLMWMYYEEYLESKNKAS